LIDKKFGKLTVIEKTDERKDGRVIWLCTCDCGNTKKVTTKSLTTGVTKSCGCLLKRDLAGKKFGKLKVIEPTGELDERGVQLWSCICDCGKLHIIKTTALTGKIGTKSCGCTHKQDLIGSTFGNLTVRELTSSREGNRRIWRCVCDCGGEKDVTTSDLTSGKIIQCDNVIHRINDLTGEVVGQLTVTEPLDKRSHGSVVWRCRCSCGSITEVPSNHLVTGHTSSCGCSTVSKGEQSIAEELESLGVTYQKEYMFTDLKLISFLRYDFAVFDSRNNLIGLIEYDGQQHFKPIKFFGGEDTFKKVTERDKLKNRYCKKENIPLLRIRYDEYDSIESIVRETINKWRI